MSEFVSTLEVWFEAGDEDHADDILAGWKRWLKKHREVVGVEITEPEAM